MKRSALEMALLPTPQDGPRVSLVRGDVTSPGMVSTEPGDVVGSPIDGPAVSGSGAVLTIDGHRLFIPYGAVTAPEVVEQVQQLADIATGTQDAVSETHTTAVDAAEQAEVANAAVDAAMVELAAAQEAAEAANAAATAALAGADAAVHVANLAEAAAQGIVKVERFDPGHYPGRIWYQTNASGQGIGVKVSKSGNWVPYMLLADQVLVPSSVGSVLIADGAITAPKLHVDALNFKSATGMELTSGILTGTMFRSSTSGTRIQIDRENLGGRLRYLDSSSNSRIAMEVNAGGGYLSFYTTTGREALKVSQADGLTIDSSKIVMNSNQLLGDWTSQVHLAAPVLTLRCSDYSLGFASGGLFWKLRYAQAGTASSPVHAAIWEYQGGPSRMPPITGGFPLAMSSNSGGTGTICVTTSSRRAKADIRDIEVDPYRILDVRPRDWLDRVALEADPTLTTRTPGVVAEEVEDAGLSEFVTYHNDQVQGVMYDRLPVLFIPIIKDLIKRIETLEGTRNG